MVYTPRFNTAEEQLQNSIDKRRAESMAVLTQVQNNVPQDSLVRTASVVFQPGEGELLMAGGDWQRPLTRHALGQASSRVGFPQGYAADVMAEKGGVGREVVARALTTLYAAEDPERKFLVRAVNGKVHGVLSDAYRRLDARPGLDAFISAVQKVGAVPYGGVVTDTRVQVKAILPRIFTLGSTVTDPHGTRFTDQIIIGLAWSNSDFGVGKYSLNLYTERVRCLNGMIMEALFATRHVGGRLEEGDFFSERTHKLDTATMVSATKDYVTAHLAPSAVEKTVGLLQAAASKSLDLESEINGVLKRALTKGEIKGLTSALQSVNENEMPLGPPTPYRMANALAWLANSDETEPDRKLDLQKLAGTYLKAA